MADAAGRGVPVRDESLKFRLIYRLLAQAGEEWLMRRAGAYLCVMKVLNLD